MKKSIPGLKAAEEARRTFNIRDADLAIVLGSGWSDLVSRLDICRSIPYSRLPGLGRTSVKGHTGILHFLKQGQRRILIFQGRRHFYEGAGWEPVLMPVFISLALKIKYILLTNAAGGINPKLTPGSLMLIKDHINMMGGNPLIGPHNPTLGPRFPDQTEVYDKELNSLLELSAKSAGTRIHKGVYMAVSGPAYETPAEIKAYRTLGADAIGMSTVPEAMAAHSAGIRVCAISCIANSASGTSQITHNEVIASTMKVIPAMTAIIDNFCRSLPS